MFALKPNTTLVIVNNSVKKVDFGGFKINYKMYGMKLLLYSNVVHYNILLYKI
jgi:hypothetical protein